MTKNEKKIIHMTCRETIIYLAELKEMGFAVAEIKSAVSKSRGVIEYVPAQRCKGDRSNMGQFGRGCGTGGTTLYIPAHIAVARGKDQIARRVAALKANT